MLLHTIQKQKVQDQISLSLVKVKVKFAQTEVYKNPLLEKIDPSGATQLPPQLSLSSNVLMAPPSPKFVSSSADNSPPPITRAGKALRTWGRLAALLVLKMVMVGKGTRTLLDVDIAFW